MEWDSSGLKTSEILTLEKIDMYWYDSSLKKKFLDYFS